MSGPGSEGQGRDGGDAASEGWGSAVGKAAVVLVASVLGFLVIPDRLTSYLSLHVVPKARDTLVTLWWIAFFLFLSWVFVTLQRRRAR